jgi:hypothetical protein
VDESETEAEVQRWHLLEGRATRLKEDMDKALSERTALRRDVRELAYQPREKLTPKQRDRLSRKTSQLKALAETFDERFNDLRATQTALNEARWKRKAKSALLTSKVAAVRRRIEEFRSDLLRLVIYAGFGGGISGLGFVLWYRNLQRWQDAAVRQSGGETAGSTARNREEGML